MTKKHFKAIAETIKQINFHTPSDKEILIEDLSDIFKHLNPRFNHQKFYAACWEEK